MGWYFDQTIRFPWNESTSGDSVVFYLDDANGAANVSPPLRITVGGKNFPVNDPAGAAPVAFTASAIGFAGKDLVVNMYRQNTWIFLSEVAFFGPARKVPASAEPVARARIQEAGRRHPPRARLLQGEPHESA